MKRLEQAPLKFFAKMASGPFSYISKRGFHFTVTKWSFTDDGDFILIEIPAAQALSRVETLMAIEELKIVLDKTLDLAYRLDYTEVVSLIAKAKDLPNNIGLRYETFRESYKGDE